MMLNKNLEIIKGNDQLYTLTFTDSAGVIDITQWTIYYVIKEPKTLAIVINKEITDHSDPTHGISQIILTHQETNITRGGYKYSITVQTGADEIYSILSGTLVVKEP
jgi:hypothetical protein